MKRTLKFITIIIATLVIIFTSSNALFVKNARAEDKIYTVPVELWHSENNGKLSMGNNALATHANVTIHDNNSSTITVQFVPMDFSNMHGHLLSLSIYSTPLFSGNLTSASVVSTYTDTNLDGGSSTYPGTLSFNFPEAKPDKVGVRVSVDAMNQIMGGDASQNAILKFDWSAATLTSGSDSDSKDNKTDKKDSDKKEESKTPDGFNKKNVGDYFNDNQQTKNTGIYTIDITGSYLNPLTGVTADGGTKNAAIGEGMVQGVISPINGGGDINEAMKNQSNSEKRWSKALLQRTKDGKLYATVRVHLMNWVKRSSEQGPFIKVLQKDGEFKQVEATETKVNIEQYKDNYVDYRFEVPNENFLAMVQMYVEPMNRPVRFFVEVNPNTIQEGNSGLDMEVIEEKDYLPYYIAGGVGILVILAGSFTILKKRKNH